MLKEVMEAKWREFQAKNPFAKKISRGGGGEGEAGDGESTDINESGDDTMRKDVRKHNKLFLRQQL